MILTDIEDRGTLKILCPQGRSGSSPVSGNARGPVERLDLFALVGLVGTRNGASAEAELAQGSAAEAARSRTTGRLRASPVSGYITGTRSDP